MGLSRAQGEQWNAARQDLLDRLAFDVITVPPLRERLEDILPLAYAFAINMASELKRELFAGFGARASSSLLQHDWPGNVRELKNTVERSVYREPDPDKLIAQIAFDPFDSPFELPSESPVPGAPVREKRPPLLPMPAAEGRDLAGKLQRDFRFDIKL